MQELSSIFIKPNLAFYSAWLLLRLSPSWTKEGCLSVQCVHAAPQLFSFHFPAKGQCDTSGVYHHRTQDNVCIVCLPLFVSQKFSMQIKGIFVIIQNYQPLFAKSFNLGTNFKIFEGFSCKMQVIMILAALLHLSPKL